MKLITFAVPSYNSEAYLEKCVDSLLVGGPEVEIIIVNDGSTDHTAEIADRYAREYPDIVRVIHKENGGHGSGVNAGLAQASGLYYKVVDSDDRLEAGALRRLLKVVRTHEEKKIAADLYITNFVYDKPSTGKSFTRHWRGCLPRNSFCDWNDAKSFFAARVMMMHALLYRTEKLRACGLKLPERTFYVDILYAYQPLPYMKRLYYLDVDLYIYFIGRDDQSVNVNNFKKRYDQQLRVMRAMVDAYRSDELDALPAGLRRYMYHNISAIMMNTILFCTSGGDDEKRKSAYLALWKHIRYRDPELYRRMRRSYPALLVYLPWKLRGKVALWGYHMLCRRIPLG